MDPPLKRRLLLILSVGLQIFMHVFHKLVKLCHLFILVLIPIGKVCYFESWHVGRSNLLFVRFLLHPLFVLYEELLKLLNTFLLVFPLVLDPLLFRWLWHLTTGRHHLEFSFHGIEFPRFLWHTKLLIFLFDTLDFLLGYLGIGLYNLGRVFEEKRGVNFSNCNI